MWISSSALHIVSGPCRVGNAPHHLATDRRRNRDRKGCWVFGHRAILGFG